MNNRIVVPSRHISMNHNVTIVVRDAATMKPEEWRDIQGYEGMYQVSSYGNVKRVAHDIEFERQGKICVRHLDERMFSLPKPGKEGYLSIQLTKDGKGKDYLVHRLVALAFIPQIEGKPQVNHKDGNKQNNYVENLEWMDAREQQLHAWSIGLIPESHRAEIGEQARLRNTGVKFSDEHKKRISESLKKHRRTPEHRKHISESLKGRKVSDEEKERLRTLFLGRHHSEETKEYLRKINTGRRYDKATHTFIKPEEVNDETSTNQSAR